MWVHRTKAKRILFAVWLLLLRLFNILEIQWNNSEKDELLELVPDALQGILDHVIPCVVTPGGYSIYPWVGRCGAAPHTLTLFKTNIADFPGLFKTEFRFLTPCLRHLINIRDCKNFAVYRPRKEILFKTKIDKSIPWLRQKMINSIPCLRQKSRKNIHWLAARPH